MIVSEARARISASPKLHSWAALVAVYLLWGSTYTGIQVAVRYIPPLLMAGTRYLLAGALLYLVVGREGSWRRWPARWSRPSRTEALSAGVVGLFLLLGGNGLVTLGEVKVKSGLASLMIATVPLWMALLGLALKGSRRPGPLGWIGVVLGLGGVAVLVDPSSGGHLSLISSAGLLGAAILWSIGSLYAQRAPLARNVLLVSAVEMLVGGLALILVGLLTGEASQVRLAHIGLPALIAYGWLVTGGSIAGYTCYTYALKVLPSTTVATYAYVNPVVALLLGWLILGQGLTPTAGLAAVLITLGVVLMVSGPALARRRVRGRLAHAPPH
ncbi:MAG TPA: EamA family transporter [Candidatus Dormibacteraeota bacterium]|nr:EamA family transporter [Candidatus Dormibacteraeota bacterium]